MFFGHGLGIRWSFCKGFSQREINTALTRERRCLMQSSALVLCRWKGSIPQRRGTSSCCFQTARTMQGLPDWKRLRVHASGPIRRYSRSSQPRRLIATQAGRRHSESLRKRRVDDCFTRKTLTIQFGPIYRRSSREMRNQYRLVYNPAELKHDGAFHEIELQPPDRVSRVAVRSGYFAPRH